MLSSAKPCFCQPHRWQRSAVATGAAAVSGDDGTYTQTIETLARAAARRTPAWPDLLAPARSACTADETASAAPRTTTSAGHNRPTGVVTLGGKTRVALDPVSGCRYQRKCGRRASRSTIATESPRQVTARPTSSSSTAPARRVAYDSEASTRRHFGIDHFAIDPSPGASRRFPSIRRTSWKCLMVIGTVEKYLVSGKAAFQRDGKDVRAAAGDRSARRPGAVPHLCRPHQRQGKP